MTSPEIPDAAVEALLPCPFCGGEAERVDIEDGDNAGGSCVCCKQCLASSNVEFGFKENFVSNWNRRAALPHLAAGRAEAVSAGWRTMDTAPKDGTRILLAWEPFGGLSEHVELGKWKTGLGWCNTYGKPFSGDVDAWAPLAPFDGSALVSAPAAEAEPVAWPSGFFVLGGDARLRDCATEGCGQHVSIRIERDGTGSEHCEPCARKIAATLAAPSPSQEALSDRKWLDPECGVEGCQSLVWKARYEAAVNGRRDFRQAYREARASQEALREALASHIATVIDDIEVTKDGFCKWSDVANARDAIYRTVRRAALAQSAPVKGGE